MLLLHCARHATCTDIMPCQMYLYNTFHIDIYNHLESILQIPRPKTHTSTCTSQEKSLKEKKS